MRKRGELILVSLIGLILGGIAFVAVPMIAKACANGEICLKAAAARDIALIIDTLYIYPYDIELEYGYDLSGIIIEISQSSVKTYGKSSVTVEGGKVQEIRRDPSLEKYGFAPIKNSNDDLNIILEQPKKIIFKKENGKITITGIK